MSTSRILFASLLLLGSGCSGEPDGDQVGSRTGAIQPVTWRNAFGVSAVDNDLTKTNGQTLWNAGASSLQTVDGDAYAEFSTGEATTHKAAGLSSGDSDRTLSDIDFAVHLKANGTFDIVEGGVVRLPAAGTYAADDLFRVQVVAGVATYWHNGALVHTSSATPTFPLVVDTSLRTPGATVQNVRIDSLVFWTNEAGVAVVGNDLSKTAPEIAWNAGASSLASFEGDGYVEFTTGERTTDKIAGLNRVDNSQGFQDIDFGIYLRANGRFAVREKGDDPVGTGFGPYQAGDVFRIEVSSGVVTYARNGTVFYTSLLAPASSLHFDTSLRTPGATILDAVLVAFHQCFLSETLAQSPQRDDIDLAADGDRLVVGNSRDLLQDPYVWVYRRSGDGWIREQVVDTRQSGNPLGGSVNIDGDIIAVGSWEDDEFGSNEGSVRTYRHDGVEWIPDQVLGGCTENSQWFGKQVALHGDLLTVSDLNVNDGSNVYLYRRGPAGFALEAVLPGPDESFWGFGATMTIGGNRIFVSHTGRRVGTTDLAGTVYVYRYGVNRPDPPGPPTCAELHPGKWVQEALLVSPNPQSYDGFASGLAVNSTGTLLLAGNPQRGFTCDGCPPNGPGEAYLFVRSGLTWELRQTLTASDGEPDDDFGDRVAFGGPDPVNPSFAVIGAPYFGPGDGYLDDPPGAAYLFRPVGEIWTEAERLDSPDAPESYEVGHSVAANDTEAFVSQQFPPAVHVHDVSTCE